MIETSVIDPDLAIQIIEEDRREIAYDTETSGLTVTDFICGYVVTSWEYSIYIPVRHEGGGNIPDVEAFESRLAKAFKTRSRLGYRTVGHNLGFDLRSSLRHGVVLGSPLEDTMINEALIDDTTIGYGLDDTSERRKVTVKKGDELYAAIAAKFGGLATRKQMENFWRMPGDHPLVLDYATGDGVSTLEVWRAQQPLLDELEVRKPWKLECDLLPYLARMHNRGLKVDMNYGSSALKKIAESIEAAKRKFPPGFNSMAPTQVEALYRKAGYSDEHFARTAPTAKKPNGQISFTAKWLETNPIGQDILSVRKLEKARDSFITPLYDTNNVNGRVYPVLNQSKSDEYGVAGARLSCSVPNLQAYPKRDHAVGEIVRPLIIPDDGMLIEEADAMQQEPRFFTHYSGDPALIEGYTTGTLDIHQRASDVLHMDREYAKRLGLGILTMMSAKTLAMHMNYTENEGKRDKALYLDDAFPLIRDFQNTAIRVYKSRGYVKSILGRRAWCRDVRFGYQAVSRIIQNSGGDHMKTVLLRINQYEDVFPDKVQALLSIHDSGIWQRDPGHDPRELIKIMENVPHEDDFKVIVPIPFELGSGKHWGEASYGKKLKDKKGWVGSLAS